MKAVYNNRGVKVPGMIMKEGGSFPDMNKDGKITQGDIYLKKKENGTIAKKGTETKKLDRCATIAKRKYKVWPSAYASGAAVKCRQGKIWKGQS